MKIREFSAFADRDRETPGGGTCRDTSCGEAVEWLSRAFGFTLRIRMGNHRAQLNVGDEGAVVLVEESSNVSLRTAVMVRVEDVNTHCEARQAQSRKDYPGTERLPLGRTAILMLKTSPVTVGVSRNPLQTSIQEHGAEHPAFCSETP